MKAFFNVILDKIFDIIRGVSPVLVIAICFSLIVIVIYIAITKINKEGKHPHLSVIFSTLLSCFCMVPMMVSFVKIIDNAAASRIIDEANESVRRARAEASLLMLEQEKLTLQVENAKQQLEIESLSTSKMLLERAKLSMQSFEQIAQVALTQARLKYTLLRKEPITPLEEGWGIRAEFFNDEVLVITNFDINAKFGVDLSQIKVKKTQNNSVLVSGITPTYIGSDVYERYPVISEIRRNRYKMGILDTVERYNGRTYQLLAQNKADQFELDFQRNLSRGMEITFMDEAVIQLAKNFIRIILAPIYDNIEFVSEDYPDALPIMEYLNQELQNADEEKYNRLQISEQILIDLSNLYRSSEEDINNYEVENSE